MCVKKTKNNQCICCLGLDNLARCGALESLVESAVLDDTWDNQATNRMSTIRFLDDDDDDDDDEEVRKNEALLNVLYGFSMIMSFVKWFIRCLFSGVLVYRWTPTNLSLRYTLCLQGHIHFVNKILTEIKIPTLNYKYQF